MFASCNGDENGEEDLGEMMDITVTVRVVGNDGYVLVPDLEMPLSDYASRLTVLEATVRALQASDINYGLAGGSFTYIGDYRVAEGYFVDDYTGDEDENGEDYDDYYENGDETEAFVDYIWLFTLNGREVSSSTQLSDGDVIIWTFAPSGF